MGLQSRWFCTVNQTRDFGGTQIVKVARMTSLTPDDFPAAKTIYESGQRGNDA